jgi:serpin B
MRAWASVLAALAIAAVVVPLTATCGGDDAAAADVLRSDAERASADIAAAADAADALNAFSADLYGALAAGEGNVVFSPYSVAVALAMTRLGASGETLAQMDAVLHTADAGDLDAALNAIDQALATRPGEYDLNGETVDLELATANQLWGQRGYEFAPAYLDVLASNYGAGLRIVDFEGATEDARQAINEWVAEQTRERIPELVAEGVLTELTRLVLTNAIYLKAPWTYEFDEDSTGPAPFHLLGGSETEVQMMRLDEQLTYFAGAGYEAVELPYVDGSLSMWVVVPEEGEFETFESALASEILAELFEGAEPREVELGLPKFEFRTQASLADALKALGMPIAFTDAADFSQMTPAENDLYIQDVIHEAFISVDEHGTEAAAATAVVVGVTSAPPPEEKVELTVDRPFLFLIRDSETGAILFMGRVLDPNE